MPPLVAILTGPAGCGKTDRLLQRYRTVLSSAPPGSVLWLSPTSRAEAEVRSRVMAGSGERGAARKTGREERLDGCFAPGITTFARFARTVLERSPQPVRPLGSLLKRHLIRQIVDEEVHAGRLNHFGPIAATGGLLDLLCDFIRQMKRLEIWPEQFAAACAQRGLTQKDRELLAIYRAYQQRLLDHNLYDAEGCFWSARDLLRRQPLVYQLIVADGFSDFTRTEHDILDELAAKAAEVWISLPLEAGRVGFSPPENDVGWDQPWRVPPPAANWWDSPRLGPPYDETGLQPTRQFRQDLFQKPLKTLAELQRRHANLSVEAVGRPAEPVWPALDHVERTIFSNPRMMTPAPDTAGLEILAGGRQLGEIELIGRRIKRLLLEGDRGTERIGGTRLGSAHPTTPHDEYDENVRPGQIAVVFRRPEALAELVSEGFQRQGIPFYLEAGQLLNRSPAIVMLLRLLELDADDWPMYKLLGVLGSNYFALNNLPHDWNDLTASRVERTIRNQQIPRGRERLLEQLQGARSREQRDGGSALRSTTPYEEGVPYCAAVLRFLADALDELPQYDTLAAHARAWLQLADRVGILRSIRGDADQAAWNQLQETLRESQRLAAWLGQDAPRLDRKQAYQALLDIVNNQSLGAASDETGRVRVLSAASVRHLQIPYLFVAGLAEKAFPAADRDDGVYSAAEHQHLIEAGLPLPSRSDRQTDEMLLFYETITSATRRLYLSYPAVDESGEPLAPSPYLQEVRQACEGGEEQAGSRERGAGSNEQGAGSKEQGADGSGEGAPGGKEQGVSRREIRIARFEQIDLSPVPEVNDLCSLDAFRIRAVFDAIEGKPERLAGFEEYTHNNMPSRRGVKACHPDVEACQPAGAQRGTGPASSLTLRVGVGEDGMNSVLLSGLEFSLARQNRDRFGTAEGMLSSAVAASLAADFPRERIFSATELERYAYCPYQFFLNKVLNVQPLEEVELEVDYRERGQMAHELLAAFHRRVNAAGGRAQSPVALAPDDYQRLLAETIAETLSPGGRDSLADALREVDRRILLQWLQSYRQQHEKYDSQWKEGDGPPRPAFFEVSFGKALREGDSPPSTDKPLELASGDQVVRLAGRIDRIDLGDIRGQPIFNILDYKTGSGAKFSLEACQRGTVLQLPLYAMAAAELILNDRDALPWQAGYWYLSGDGFKPRQALRMYELVEDHLSPSAVWESIRGILAGTVVGLIKAMRAGQFPVWSDDPDCTGRCPYKTVCRINQIRSLDKTWRPPSP